MYSTCVVEYFDLLHQLQMLLPENLERKNNKVYEEVNIPPSDPAPTHIGQQRIRIDQLDDVNQ